jgi:hypothetical protein
MSFRSINSSRSEVFDAINGERNYQDHKWNEDTTESGGRHTLTEWIMFIEDYVDEAKRVYSREPDPDASIFVQHTLRKIAALAVAAMEEHGAQTRQVEGPRAVGVRRA